jgi:hypothetical protein
MTNVYLFKLRKVIIIICLLFLYRILLDFSYEEVAHIFDYQGLFFNNKSFLSILFSWFFFILLLPLIVRLFYGRQLSDYILILLVLFSLIPQLVVISHRSDYSFKFVLLVVFFWLLLFILHFYISPIRIRLRASRLISKIPHLILLILLASILVFSYISTGLRLHTDLIEVYEIREEARGFGVIFPFNYIISFADNALAFFAVLLFHRRQYAYFIFTLFVIYVNFSITGTKQIVFLPLCGLLGYYFIRNGESLVRILISAVALIIFSFIEIDFLDSRVLTIIYPYRVLFIPAELHYSYFNFFQINELDLYRQSFLKAFLDSPYEENIQFLLGEFATGDVGGRANNGLFSDAFMNLGSLGVIIHPFLIVVLLRLFDGVASRIDKRLWFVVAIYMSFVLLGMTISSALLSSGLLPFLLMLYLFPYARRTASKI